jgi:hypothetical protein
MLATLRRFGSFLTPHRPRLGGTDPCFVAAACRHLQKGGEMLRIRYLVLATAVVSLSAGVAIGAAQPSETTPVTADFRASPVSAKERPCDATHTKFRVVFEGSQTSSDARLTGALKARVRSVVNTQNGYGYTVGKVRIRDTTSGRLKFRGRVVGVLEPGGGVEGFLSGRTSGRPSARLLANFNAQQDASGAITGELGNDSQTGQIQDPAILSRACRGDDNGDDGDDD